MLDQEMAAACFANRLRAASRAITRHYDAALKPVELKISQLSVLTAVSLGGGTATIVEIADRLGMDRSTLSRNFDPLERRGLVALGPETRHRARRASLTPGGEALMRAAYPLWRQAQQSVGALVDDMPGTAMRLDRIIGTLA